MTHIAIWEAPAEASETEFGEQVTEAEYLGRKEVPMANWTADELTKIGRAEELQISSRRPDGSLRPYVTIWVARSGDAIYVRSAHGYSNPWFQRALASKEGRIRVGGIERDVVFEVPRP